RTGNGSRVHDDRLLLQLLTRQLRDLGQDGELEGAGDVVPCPEPTIEALGDERGSDSDDQADEATQETTRDRRVEARSGRGARAPVLLLLALLRLGRLVVLAQLGPVAQRVVGARGDRDRRGGLERRQTTGGRAGRSQLLESLEREAVLVDEPVPLGAGGV